MKALKKTFLSLIFAAPLFCSAQNKDAEKYHAASEEVRKQVWGWDKPQFKIKEIPKEYAGASKVVLAQHTELTAESKSKFAFYVVSFGVKKEQTITEVVRELVKLNDKTAVDEYSQLSFTQFEKHSGFFQRDKLTAYVGVRVIKPNGSIKEINADDIVLTKDESTEKQAKVAIPDLQPGDILDFFMATELQVTNDFSTKTYNIFLFENAPVLSKSFHGQLGKKYAIEYRSYNAAPDLKVNKNDDNDIVIDVEKTNMAPFETSLWVAPGMQLPFIRMHISLGYKGLGSRYMDTKKPGEVLKNTNAEEFFEAKAENHSSEYYSGYWMKAAKAEYDAIESDAKSKAKKMGLSFKELSDEEKAAHLYYTLRFTKLLNFDINDMSRKIGIGDYKFNGLAFPLFCTFKASGLDPAILVSAYRTGLRPKEIMSSSDLTSTAYIPGSNKFFWLESVYDAAYSVQDDIEGMTDTRSFTFDHPNAIMSLKKMEGLTNIAPGPNVPVSSSDKNAHIENLQIALTADKGNLSVKRSTTMKGYYKRDMQRRLILYEDLYEAERKAFGEEKSLLEDLEDGKKSRKYVDEVRSAFAEARKKQKDAFAKEAKEWFEQEVTELKDYKTDNLGIRHTKPDFVYSSSFNLGGLIKKAGNNYIIEIGKIQGQPLSVKQEQRKRDIDVYMPYARSIEYNINLEIPEGYTAEGISALNKKVENETGYFVTEATTTDKTLTIKLKKHYLHNFEPAKNWNKLLEFIDASNEWTNAKLLLKKK
jgi:Domain of Unknown Function with PDB structure (DUF3857)